MTAHPDRTPVDPDTGKPRCTANAKNGKGRCKNPPVKGRRTCRMHGGTQPVGVASPNATRDGIYSPYLRDTSLREKYHTIANNPRRASMESDMVLTQALMADALERMGDGANARSRTLMAIRKAYDDFEANNRAGKKQEAAVSWIRLGQTIDRALEERSARDEVIRLSDHHRKLMEAELKIVVASRTVMTAEESNALSQALIDAVFDTVKDPDVRREIGIRFAALLNLPQGKGNPNDE